PSWSGSSLASLHIVMAGLVPAIRPDGSGPARSFGAIYRSTAVQASDRSQSRPSGSEKGHSSPGCHARYPHTAHPSEGWGPDATLRREHTWRTVGSDLFKARGVIWTPAFAGVSGRGSSGLRIRASHPAMTEEERLNHAQFFARRGEGFYRLVDVLEG